MTIHRDHAIPKTPDRVIRDLIEKALARNLLVSEIMDEYHVPYDLVHEIKIELALIDYRQKKTLRRKMM